MSPLGAVLRLLHGVISSLILPPLARKLQDPQIVNKMSNSGPIRTAARQAVKLRMGFDKFMEEIKLENERAAEKEKLIEEEKTGPRDGVRTKSRETVQKTADELKRSQKK